MLNLSDGISNASQSTLIRAFCEASHSSSSHDMVMSCCDTLCCYKTKYFVSINYSFNSIPQNCFLTHFGGRS